MTEHHSYKLESTLRRTPRRAVVEEDRINGGWVYVVWNGNRKVETSETYPTRAKADYAMRQMFAGTLVRLWGGP